MTKHKKVKIYRRPDRLKADGSKDDRNWPVNSGHKKAENMTIIKDKE